MKTVAVLVATAALASAQITYNNATGQYSCKKAGSYCVGVALETDIIIRCDDTLVGVTGRCEDELAGLPGGYTAMCWQSSSSAGDAVCEKNCNTGSTTLPASVCTPTGTVTTTDIVSTPTGTVTTTDIVSTPTGTVTTTDIVSITTTECPETSSTSTWTPPPTTTPWDETTTEVQTVTTTECPETSSTPGWTTVSTPGVSVSSSIVVSSNGTSSIWVSPTSATATPVGPTSTGSTGTILPTSAASANRVGVALAAVGLVVAYIL